MEEQRVHVWPTTLRIIGTLLSCRAALVTRPAAAPGEIAEWKRAIEVLQPQSSALTLRLETLETQRGEFPQAHAPYAAPEEIR